jgi:ABC-type nitrate/sulfonate/bicarbonate transport system ATPase subunit
MVLLTTHQLDLAVLSSDMVIPFRARPVAFTNAAIIKVDLPRPRSNHMRTSQQFQEVLCIVEDVFRAPGTKATTNGP